MASFFQTKVEYLKGVGPDRAALLHQELGIATFEDLIHYYPFRYEDRSQFYKIKELKEGMPCIQTRGIIYNLKVVSSGKKRIVASLRDDTGEVSLVWFQRLQWILKNLQTNVVYTVLGKPAFHNHQITLIHPELEVHIPNPKRNFPLYPVYHSTEKLKAKRLDSKAIARLQSNLVQKFTDNTVSETLPSYILQRYKLVSREFSLFNVHLPFNTTALQQARFRLKFEELFYIQLQLLQLKKIRLEKQPGAVLKGTQLLNRFYHTYLPFSLTEAQKRVFKELYQDMRSGKQMNRLVQGDVGSGKTIVAFLTMLVAIGSGTQVAMMAPTELLAEQHYQGLQRFAQQLGLHVALLTGSTKKSAREETMDALSKGRIHIVIGTHSLLNEAVRFNNLGLAIIDEQHRFGVAQRARLWTKNQGYFPHVLIMTATPIPRTLAMTFYGDLDVSVIDMMPAGRKPIKTVHYYDAQRLKVFQLLKEQIIAGRQVYIVYPLIEESEKLDYKSLMDGYESICRAFPEFPISIIHGQMSAIDKDYEMHRFAKGETKIMVATTVIEVGIDVPNATVMVIESAERFGLAQLHQLRGRVGRGSQQSYCILMTDYKLNSKGRERIQAMVRTNDGFEIADLDLQLRGPGDLLGVQQSGLLALKIADLGKDGRILQVAREAAKQVIGEDPSLTDPKNLLLKTQLEHTHSNTVNWSSIS